MKKEDVSFQDFGRVDTESNRKLRDRALGKYFNRKSDNYFKDETEYIPPTPEQIARLKDAETIRKRKEYGLLLLMFSAAVLIAALVFLLS